MSPIDRQVACHPLVDDGGVVVGQFTSETVISGVSTAPMAWSGRLIARSGGVVDEDAERAAMRTWGGEGVRLLDEGLERWLGKCGGEAGDRLCIWPNARDAVSDLPSCLSMLRRWEGRAVEAICDPLAMLTPEMSRVADDFVLRMLETLAPLGTVPVVVARAGLSEKQVEMVKRFAAEAGKPVVSGAGMSL